MRKILGLLLGLCCSGMLWPKTVNGDALVHETHKASLQARQQAIQKTVAKDNYWIKGAWGDTIWCLAALYQNEKVAEANARLLKRANDYIALKKKKKAQPKFLPESENATPWSYFALTDYVRILCLFHSKSLHFPGRLTLQTEAAMKEALWYWVKSESKVAEASLDHLLVLIGTENHDLVLRPNYYLISAILKEDPKFRNRKYDDGHTAAEHAAAYTIFFREWPRKRVQTGLWIEVGSNTYQKYSWPSLFNLQDLSPDPIIRRRFGMLMDLAFIEEAQIAIRGRRGGGRSRASGGRNSFESYKNLLYAPKGVQYGASHSKVMETSRYQLPAEAILLRKKEFPRTEPFLIQNRVLGELAKAKASKGEHNHFAADSALVNYAYRTPYYLIGSTLQNPALKPGLENGKLKVNYGGISRQNRWCGVLFHNPKDKEVAGVYPVIEKTGGGRPQHPYWSVQHKNVLLVQRIPPESRRRMGSYNTGKIGIHFPRDILAIMEKNGWIFAANKQAFVAVKFLDGSYQWDEQKKVVSPSQFDHKSDKSRILIHAGDVNSHQSFSEFRKAVIANPLQVNSEQVNYQFMNGQLEVTSFDGDQLQNYKLPRINGKPINLRPAKTFDSPYLQNDFGSDKVSIKVGPIQRVLDFSK